MSLSWLKSKAFNDIDHLKQVINVMRSSDGGKARSDQEAYFT